MDRRGVFASALGLARILSYRSYALYRSSRPLSQKQVARVHKDIQCMYNCGVEAFDGSDPMKIFEFLQVFVHQAAALQYNEGQAFLILPGFLKGEALRHFMAERTGHISSAGIFNWPSSASSTDSTNASAGCCTATLNGPPPARCGRSWKKRAFMGTPCAPKRESHPGDRLRPRESRRQTPHASWHWTRRDRKAAPKS